MEMVYISMTLRKVIVMVFVLQYGTSLLTCKDYYMITIVYD